MSIKKRLCYAAMSHFLQTQKMFDCLGEDDGGENEGRGREVLVPNRKGKLSLNKWIQGKENRKQGIEGDRKCYANKLEIVPAYRQRVCRNTEIILAQTLDANSPSYRSLLQC